MSSKEIVQFHNIGFKQQIIPIYCVVRTSVCQCQLNTTIDQILKKTFGFAVDFQTVTSFQLKMQINPYSIQFVNNENLYVIQGLVAQRSIKKFVNTLYMLQNLKEFKIEQFHIFNGGDTFVKYIKEFLSTFVPEQKVTKLVLQNCNCGKADEKEGGAEDVPKYDIIQNSTKSDGMYEAEYQADNQKSLLLFYMQYQKFNVTVKDMNINIKSDVKIPKPNEGQMTKFLKQLDKIVKKVQKKMGIDVLEELYFWQGISSGFLYKMK